MIKALSLFLLIFFLFGQSSAQQIFTTQTKVGSININGVQNETVKADTEPPEITVLSGQDSCYTATYKLKGRVSDANPINFTAIFNQAGQTVLFSEKSNSFEVDLNLQPGENQFIIKSQDVFTNSNQLSFSIFYRETRKDYALIFAVQDYSDSTKWSRPNNVAGDALRLKKCLETTYNFETEYVLNPDMKSIEDKLTEYAGKDYNPQDQLLIFWSGHGAVREMGNRKFGYFISSDSQKFSHGDFAKFVDAGNCNHILILADACYSGLMDISDYKTESDIERIIDSDMYGEKNLRQIIEQNLQKTTRKVIASAETESPGGWRGQGSPFMNKLFEALEQSNDRVVEYYELKSKITELSAPEPIHGFFSQTDEAQSNFLFIKR